MDADAILQAGGIFISGAAGVKIVEIVVRAWSARNQKTKIDPPIPPVDVRVSDPFVRRSEFEKHVSDNARDHENLFGRMNRNDRDTSEIRGILTGMRDDLSAIKGKLFKTRGA